MNDNKDSNKKFIPKQNVDHKKASAKLTKKILIGLALGFIVGIILNILPSSYVKNDIIINGVFHLSGQVFLRAIQMLVVPLVFISLVNGVTGISDIKKFGRVGVKTFIYYLTTTAIAITLALTFSLITNPGKGLDLSKVQKQEIKINHKEPIVETLSKIIPRNPFEAFAEGNMLQTIIWALFFGTAIAIINRKINYLPTLFEELNDVMMKIVDLVMMLAPYGVFGLIAKTFSSVGFEAMIPLLKYMFTIILVLLIHTLVVYAGMLTLIGKLNPLKFFSKYFSPISVAFSSASSGATLPVTLETVEQELGVNKSLASFTIPFGATINMDGTAIMQGVASFFIAQVYGIYLPLSAFLTIILTATLASIGTAAVPGVGLIMLSMVFTSVGLPLEGIALIIGIDRILDMCRTATNVIGDGVCTCIVAKSENEINLDTFNS